MVQKAGIGTTALHNCVHGAGYEKGALERSANFFLQHLLYHNRNNRLKQKVHYMEVNVYHCNFPGKFANAVFYFVNGRITPVSALKKCNNRGIFD